MFKTGVLPVDGLPTGVAPRPHTRRIWDFWPQFTRCLGLRPTAMRSFVNVLVLFDD
jgi:hypothetical protein